MLASAPRQFASDVALEVFIHGEGRDIPLGSTLDGPISVPLSESWFVRHCDHELGDAHLPELLAEVKRAAIPGLSLSSLRHVSPSAMADIATLDHLTYLDLFNTSANDDVVGALRPLDKLAGLDLSGTAISDAASGHISELTALRRLSLGWTDLTSEGVGALARRTTLTHLSLRGVSIDASALRAIASLPLEHLDLQETALGDLELEALADLSPTLAHLNLAYSAVTQDGVALLAAFPRLRALVLRGSAVRRDAPEIRSLEQKLGGATLGTHGEVGGLVF